MRDGARETTKEFPGGHIGTHQANQADANEGLAGDEVDWRLQIVVAGWGRRGSGENGVEPFFPLTLTLTLPLPMRWVVGYGIRHLASLGFLDA